MKLLWRVIPEQLREVDGRGLDCRHLAAKVKDQIVPVGVKRDRLYRVPLTPRSTTVPETATATTRAGIASPDIPIRCHQCSAVVICGVIRVLVCPVERVVLLLLLS